MKKDFVEDTTHNEYPMYSDYDFCVAIGNYAKDYIKEERQLTSCIDKKIRDAVLVDAINYIGHTIFYDYGFTTNNLYKKEKKYTNVNSDYLLTVTVNLISRYIFSKYEKEKDDSDSIKNFQVSAIEDGAIVLLDFLNYISERNNYSRIFTMQDLKDKNDYFTKKHEMDKLKTFLSATEQYTIALQQGKNIDDLFKEVADTYRFKRIAKDGLYYDKNNHIMNQWSKNTIEEELYALGYAYAKHDDPKKAKPKSLTLRKIINEMCKE